MLRKLLEVLGLVQSRKIQVRYIPNDPCVTLDSLAVVRILSHRQESRRR